MSFSTKRLRDFARHLRDGGSFNTPGAASMIEEAAIEIERLNACAQQPMNPVAWRWRYEKDTPIGGHPHWRVVDSEPSNYDSIVGCAIISEPLFALNTTQRRSDPIDEEVRRTNPADTEC